MKLTNRWNRFIYHLWSPVYDGLFDRFFAAPGRRRAIQILNLQRGERVLLAGIGTGADLPLLPPGVQAVGLDYSAHMLARAKSKLPLPGQSVALMLGDAQSLPLQSNSFDAVVLNLILSVVPDGAACLGEALRALQPSGRMVIFDKFAPETGRLTFRRKLLNLITMLLGTDITRRFSDINARGRCHVTHDEPSLLHGAYRIMLARPKEEPDTSTLPISKEAEPMIADSASIPR